MTLPPDQISGYPLLAQAARLLDEGRTEQAAQRTIEHLRQYPDEPRGLAQLGMIAMQLGALNQAAHFLQLARSKGADSFDVRRSLAGVLNQQERLGEARTMFEALRQERDDWTISGLLALILERLGQHDEAMLIQQDLVAKHPDNPHVRIAYGHSLRAAGRVEEAIAAYRKATDIDYECGDAWWGLASIKRPVLTDEDVTSIRNGIAVAIDVRNSAPLHFSLARALHDRKDYPQAFTHYAEGNRQRAEAIGYDARELSAEVSEVTSLVDSAFMARLGAPSPDATGDAAPVPIFVVSLPRSGSTLVEQMLASHPDIEALGELPYIPAILRSVMELATRKGPVTVPRLISGLSDEQARLLGKDYLDRAGLHRKTARPFIIDKLPHNWSNILFIKRILPQAKFIDIRRPAMDCCFSNFTQSFSSAHASSFTLEDIGQCYSDYVRLMTHFDTVAPSLVHHIPYEQLVSTPETELRPVFDYLGLPWNPDVLKFHTLERVVRTPSSEQVRRPLNRDGMEIWKPYSAWLDPLRKILGPLNSSEG